MSVIVQFIVKVPDVERFVATVKKFEPRFEAEGGRNSSVHEDENDPGLMCTMAEWDGHDQMHAASEKLGQAFNEELGAGDLDWATHIWHKK